MSLLFVRISHLQTARLFNFYPAYFLVANLLVLSSCKGQIQNDKNLGEKGSAKISIEELQNKSMELQGKEEARYETYPNHYNGIVDFRYAAKRVTPAVVHIKSTYRPGRGGDSHEGEEDFYHGIPDPFKEFFKEDPLFRQFEFRLPDSPHARPEQAAGSGVIITDNGYILTNHHVVSDADEIEVILNDRRSYEATIVGSDPQTDLALLKIKEENLRFVKFGNSDSTETGEWVVAVGNPFNLASTVTAGIISAKARSINILRNQGAIESFIQTDAAVNPGNSGGALVKLNGELIGINTAIATPTGVYAGYAFAIPSNIAKKIVDDLLNYGIAQRGYLGVIIRDLDGKLAKELNLNRTTGVYVDSLDEEGAGKKGGIRERDVIIKINDIPVNSAPELQEIIARKRPGDPIKVLLIRDGKEKELTIALKSKEGTTELVKKEQPEILKTLGLELSELSARDKRKYGVTNGIKVDKIYNGGKIKKLTDMREDFIITKVNNKVIGSIEEFIKQVEIGAGGGIMIEGKYPGDPLIYYYAFGMKK